MIYSAERIGPGETRSIEIYYKFRAWADWAMPDTDELALVFNREGVDYVSAAICYATIMTPPELDTYDPGYRSWAKTQCGYWYLPDSWFYVVWDREEELFPPPVKSYTIETCVGCWEGRHSDCPIKLRLLTDAESGAEDYYREREIRLAAGILYPGGAGTGTGPFYYSPPRTTVAHLQLCKK